MDEGVVREHRLFLAFYIDHSIMVLNAQAIIELENIDEEVRCQEFLTVSRRAFDVARRAFDLAFLDLAMRKLRLGWHNNQFIKVAHAMTEIVHISCIYLMTNGR